MSEPKRLMPAFSVDSTMRSCPHMVPHEEGWYVAYSDWEALRKELSGRTEQYNRALNWGQTEHDIVARIWAMFGSPSYEELAGRSIYDLIKEVQEKAAGK